MPPISRADDAYRVLVEESEEDWLYGLVAFAIIEEQRIEWAQHFEKNKGRPPNAAEIQGWYEDRPDSELARAKGEAETALRNYADDVLQDIRVEERAEILEGVLVHEVRLGRRVMPQLGISILGGVIGSVVFAAILTLLAIIVWWDASPIQMGKRIIQQEQGLSDGKAQNE